MTLILEEIILLTGVANTVLTTGGSMDMVSMILPFVLLIAIFYFMLIRPENKKKKAMAKMRSELAVGDVITTIGGIVGTICALKEETIVLEVGQDRVRVEFTKWAISTKGKQTEEVAK